MSLDDIEKIEVGDGGGVIVPPVTVFWKSGEIQEIRLHSGYTLEQAVTRIAEIILMHPKKKESAKLKVDLLRLMEAAL